MAFKWFGVGKNAAQETEFEFRCACCEEIHKGAPSFGFNKPPLYFDVPEEERDQRVFLNQENNPDLCIIDEKNFFIRAVLDIPIENVSEPFCWGVWVSQSQDNFEAYWENSDDERSTFGWLTVNLPFYKTYDEDGFVTNLPTNVIWQPNQQRPKILIHEVDHELYEDQRNGISWDKAIRIAQIAMHGEPS